MRGGLAERRDVPRHDKGLGILAADLVPEGQKGFKDAVNSFRPIEARRSSSVGGRVKLAAGRYRELGIFDEEEMATYRCKIASSIGPHLHTTVSKPPRCFLASESQTLGPKVQATDSGAITIFTQLGSGCRIN